MHSPDYRLTHCAHVIYLQPSSSFALDLPYTMHQSIAALAGRALGTWPGGYGQCAADGLSLWLTSGTLAAGAPRAAHLAL